MLVFHYSHPTTPAGPGFDTVIADAVEIDPQHSLTEAAAMGDAAVSVNVDDPAAAYDFKGLHRWYAVETDCPSDDHYAWDGYIGKQTIGRGDGSAVDFPIEAGRRWGLELVEDNAIFTFRVIWDTDGKRPAETAAARLAWLLGSIYLSTVHDNGRVVYPTDPLDANDYRGQFARDVLNDIGVKTGYLYFAFYEQAFGQISLFFDKPDSLTYASALKLSNVAGDVDMDDRLRGRADRRTLRATRRGSRPANTSRSPAARRTSSTSPRATNSASATWSRRPPSIKTQAKADAHATRLLADAGEQDERVTCRTQLPSSKLTAIKRGQVLQVRFQHFPGWEAFRWARVVRKTFAPPANRAQTWYDVDLELSPVKLAPSGAWSVQTPGVAFSGIPVLPRPTTPGNLLLAVLAGTGNTTIFPGEFRFLDDPPITGSPPVPPYSPAQSAAWTTIAVSTTDYSAMNIGGPCDFGTYHPHGGVCTSGQIVGVAYRQVQPGEVTTHPVAVSSTDGHDTIAVWLWELPTSALPSGVFVEQNGQAPAPQPFEVTLPTIAGNAIGILQWSTSAGHGAIPAPLTDTAILTGEELNSGLVSSNDPALNTVNADLYAQIFRLPAGGAGKVRISVNPAYHMLNYCAVVVEIPAGFVLPTIPYPANVTP